MSTSFVERATKCLATADSCVAHNVKFLMHISVVYMYVLFVLHASML